MRLPGLDGISGCGNNAVTGMESHKSRTGIQSRRASGGKEDMGHIARLRQRIVLMELLDKGQLSVTVEYLIYETCMSGGG